MAVHEALNRTYPVKVWRLIVIAVPLLTMFFGGSYGIAKFVVDQRDIAVESSSATACMLIGLVHRAGDVEAEEFIRAFIAEEYPQLNLVGCPRNILPPESTTP